MMKKKWISVLLSIVLILSLAAGCGKKATPENLLEDVGKNLAKVESVSGDMNMSFSVSLNGETVGTGMELSLEATADPQATHMSGPVTMQMSGEPLVIMIEYLYNNSRINGGVLYEDKVFYCFEN